MSKNKSWITALLICLFLLTLSLTGCIEEDESDEPISILVEINSSFILPDWNSNSAISTAKPNQQ